MTMTNRYYVYTRGAHRDLYPGGFADLENALALARMHVDGHRVTAVVVDAEGRQYADLGRSRRSVKEPRIAEGKL
jgi:hypothetical protein